MISSDTKFTLTTIASPEEGGTISPASEKYSKGEQITLKAEPSEGWRFIRWEGDWSSTQNSTLLTMNRDYSIIGVFELREYPLNITIEGEGTVIETVIEQDFADYTHGTTVELTPIPTDGWSFVEWGGDLSGSDTPKRINIDDEKNVTTVFARSIKTFGGSASDYGKSITQTSDGGYILTGTTTSIDGDFSGLSKGGTDIIVIKLDSDGNYDWIKTFGGSGQETGESITQTSDGGYILTGWTNSNDGDFSGMNNGHVDIFVIKLDSRGNSEWVKTFGGSRYDDGLSIIQSPDGGYAITGRVISNDGDFSGLNVAFTNIFVIKLDSGGNTEWIKTYGGSYSEGGASIILSSDGGYILTGWTGSNDGDFSGMNKGDDDIFVIKLDAGGNPEWIKTYGVSENETGFAITQSTDGGFILTGTTRSNDGDFSAMNRGETDIFIIKLDAGGNSEWIKTYGGSDYDFSSSISQAEDGGYVLTGYTTSNNGDFTGLSKGEVNIFVIKLNHSGDIISFQ